MFVSTATSFTNQLPADVFSAFSVSGEVTTSGGSSGDGTNIGAVAGSVVAVVVFIIVASLTVMLVCIWLVKPSITACIPYWLQSLYTARIKF